MVTRPAAWPAFEADSEFMLTIDGPEIGEPARARCAADSPAPAVAAEAEAAEPIAEIDDVCTPSATT